MCGPRPGRVRCRLSQTRPGDHNKGWYPDIGGWVARCGRGFSGFSGAPPGAQISASRRASAPTRRATRARGGGGWHRRLVQLSNDGLGRVISQILASGWRKRCPGTFRTFRILSRVGARALGIPAFAPRSEPPHARAPGAQMIWVASGSSLAFQRVSRDTPNCIFSVRLAKFRSQLENGTGA
eukprot:gene13960-biopygen6555